MYNYREQEKNDILDFIETEVNYTDFDSLDELEYYLNNVLWDEDSVTGNASGSYTFSTYRAQENLVGNWDLLVEALDEFDCNNVKYLENPESCDIAIRCYLLSDCISEALDEIKDDYKKAVESLKQKVFDKYVLSMENNGEPDDEIWEMINGVTTKEMKDYLEM